MYFVMDQMVGNRQSLGAIVLGVEFEYHVCQLSHVSPADWFRSFRRIHLWTVYEVACFLKGELLRQPPPSFTSLR